MLSTIFIVVSSVSGILALICVYLVVQLAQQTATLAEWTKENAASNVTMRQLTDLQTEMTDVVDSVASLHKSLKTLRSRIGMREVRAERKNGVAETSDGLTDEEWKKKMRFQRAMGATTK